MPRLAPAALALLLAGGVLTAGPLPTAAETEVVAAPDLGLRLLRPAWRWTLLDGEASAQILPNARLGALGPGGMVVLVVGHAAPGIDLETFARLQSTSLGPAQAEGAAVTPTTYQGHAAVRLRLAARRGRGWIDEENLYFLHAGSLIQIHARVPRAGSPSAAPVALAHSPPPPTDLDLALAPFHAAFTVATPTQAAPPGEAARPIALQGTGWRFEDGTYEHAWAGLRLPLTEGWSLLPPDTAARLDATAEAVFEERRTGTVLMLYLDADYGLGADGHREGLFRRLGPTAMSTSSRTQTLPYLGAELAFAGMSPEGPWPREIAFAARPSPGGMTVWKAIVVGDREAEGWRACRELLEGATAIEADARQRLVAMLASGPDPDARIGPTSCVRGGVWRDFAVGLTWTRPSSSWRIRPERADGALLSVHDLATGVVGTLYWEAPRGDGVFAIRPGSLDAGTCHHTVAARLSPGTEPARASLPFPVHGLDLVVTSWAVRFAASDEPRLVAAIATAPWADGCLYWKLEGPLHGGQAVDDALRQLLLGFAAPGTQLQARTATARTIEDRRLGVAFSVPDASWLVRDETPPGFEAAGGFLHALGPRQDAIVAVLDVDGRERLTERVLVTEAQRALGAMFLSSAARPPEPGTLAGRDCTCYRWDLGPARADVWVARRDGVVIALGVATAGDGSGLTIEDLADRFRWVE